MREYLWIIRLILFAVLFVIVHELGHYIMFGLTHDIPGSLVFYPTAVYFQWPIEADETRHLVSLGAFLALLPFIFVFLKKDWLEVQFLIVMFLALALAEYYASFAEQDLFISTAYNYEIIALAIVIPLLVVYILWRFF